MTTEEFSNVYEDRARADAYAAIEFPGTYELAYRDLPAIIARSVRGKRALDFGCGAGRSTRFLRELGFDVVGVDISEPMLARARDRDPAGDYRLLPNGDLGGLPPAAFDLILSAFPFDNIPTLEKKVAILSALKRLLRDGGRIVNLVSAPDIYWNEWVSFSTKDFPANLTARSGDKVLIVMLDGADRRPVEDILCTDDDYRAAYERAGLVPIETVRPLARPNDVGTPSDMSSRRGVAMPGAPKRLVSETTIAPWVIYVLGDRGRPAADREPGAHDDRSQYTVRSPRTESERRESTGP